MKYEITNIIKLIKEFDIGNSTPIECLQFINDLKEVIRNNEFVL